MGLPFFFRPCIACKHWKSQKKAKKISLNACGTSFFVCSLCQQKKQTKQTP